MLATQGRWLLIRPYTTKCFPLLPLLAVSQRCYSRGYNTPRGSRPTSRKQSYTHQQDKRNQKAREERNDKSERATQGRKEISQVHPRYPDAPKKEVPKERRSKGDRSHQVINVSAESFDQFDIDMDVKGWHKLPGLESKVMYMVEDLPEEEGDANEEPSREVGQPQELTPERIKDLLMRTAKQYVEEDQKALKKKEKESGKGKEDQQEEDQEGEETKQETRKAQGGDNKKKGEKKMEARKVDQESKKDQKGAKEENNEKRAKGKVAENEEGGKDQSGKQVDKEAEAPKEQSKKERTKDEKKAHKKAKEEKKKEKKEDKKKRDNKKEENKKEDNKKQDNKKEDNKRDDDKKEDKNKEGKKKEEKTKDSTTKEQIQQKKRERNNKEDENQKREQSKKNDEKKGGSKEVETSRLDNKSRAMKTGDRKEKGDDKGGAKGMKVDSKKEDDETMFSKIFPDLFPPLEDMKEVTAGEEGAEEEDGVDEEEDVPGVTAADAFGRRPTNIRQAAAGDRRMFPDYLPTIDEIVAFLRSERAKDLAILNMKEKCNYADYFVIATGRSDLNCSAMADNILRRYRPLMKKAGLPASVEGAGTPWVAVDIGSIVVHLFNPESRAYMALDKEHALKTDDPALMSMEDKDYFAEVDKFEENRVKKGKVR